ncbi:MULTISPECIES: ABC transporter permease subunit [Clostridium]|uniref:ABC transporter permease subunit n=1 Tax=Clostridium cibarium TaxID=2762247 RepID=A0ABR8PUJ4_9CLOT|nr:MULTISPECIES: ABC transporter permease subunit [Clostridium]MBD7911834.1 ABC transporter permease subunit [Clostridium cibarium]
MQAQISIENTNVSMKYKKKMTKSDKKSAWVSRIVLWLTLIIVLFPILAVVFASLSKGSSFTQTTLLPKSWTLENYTKVIKDTQFLKWLLNSMITCIAAAFIQLALVVPAAFAFSKLRFAFRSKGLMALLILQMFPTAMALPAILRIAYNHNGMDNLFVITILLCTGIAYNIWLMKGYMDGIPTELIEAAYVDGATTFQVFIKIILPLIKNMALVIFLFAFISAYSEFMISSALLKDKATQTIAVGMQQFIRDKFSANWTQYSAAAIMASTPVVILFLSLQKFIAKGLTAGAVKG